MEPERASEALLRAVRRRWRTLELGARAPRDTFAPAAQVARAVGTLVLEAATCRAGPAGNGARVGCAPGVERTVDAALARLVGGAPPRPAERSESRAVPRIGGGRAEPAGQRARLPQAAWWGREDALDVATDPGGPHGIWPRVSEVPRSPERRMRVVSAQACDKLLLDFACGLLDGELVPATRRLAVGGAR